MRTLNIDFETRSVANLLAVGSDKYSKDPSTKVLCASYTLDGGATMKQWRPWLGEPMPADLEDALADPDCLIRGWNV